MAIPSKPSSRLRWILDRAWGPIAILVTGSATLAWGWGNWPDILVDFGRELYVPWRLTEGEVLYRDISYLNGPLSPYLNSLWFRIFPVGLLTLTLCNIAITAGLVVLLHRILHTISNRLSANIALLVFVTIFAFIQLDAIGNYNYVSPYSHGVTHGLVLALLSVYALSFYSKRSWIVVAASGFALGLVFLTKVEMFLAAAAGTGTALVLTLWSSPPPRPLSRVAGIFALAAATPPLVAAILLSLAMPADRALAGLLGPWSSSFNSEVTSLEFYRWGMGLSKTQLHLSRLVAWLARDAAVLLPAAAIAMALRRPGWPRWAATGAAVVTVLGFARIEHEVLWTQFTRPLAVLIPLLGVWALAVFLGDRRAGRDTRASALRVALHVFAFALLAKIILNIRLFHYGFVLAMPATMLFIVALVGWIPRAIDRAGGFGRFFQWTSIACLVVGSAFMLKLAGERFDNRVHVVGSGLDSFRSGPRAIFVNAALREIEARVGTDETLAVLPEGIMVNYLARRVNPTSFTNFMPPELIIFGEDEILREFQDDPPDWVLVVHKRTDEYGVDFFGSDYGVELYSWIRRNYHAVVRIGQPPLREDTRFGIELLQRTAARSS